MFLYFLLWRIDCNPRVYRALGRVGVRSKTIAVLFAKLADEGLDRGSFSPTCLMGQPPQASQLATQKMTL